ncbi:MAG: DUF4139 domain-containing protein [bacterium]
MSRKIKIISLVAEISILWLYLPWLVIAQPPITRITIFSNNLNLVEKINIIKLKAGINEITLGPVQKGVILDSVSPQAEGCQFLEQKYNSNSVLSWKVRSEKEEETTLRVVYLTTGLNWKVSYQVMVEKEDRFMDLSAWATVENKSEMNFSQVYLTLTTQLPRQIKQGGEGTTHQNLLESYPSDSPNFSYSAPYPITLRSGEKKRILLFTRSTIPIKKVYLFDATKYGEEVREELLLKNSLDHGLGMPLPQGPVYVYKIGLTDKISFIGQDILPETPPDKTLRIFLGEAKNLEGQRIQTSYQQLPTSEKEFGYKIILHNSANLPMMVQVVEHLYGEWTVLESQPKNYVKEENRVVYEVEVPAGETQEIQYKATTK